VRRASVLRLYQTARLKYIPVHVVTQLNSAFLEAGVRVRKAGCWEKVQISFVGGRRFVLQGEALLQGREATRAQPEEMFGKLRLSYKF